MKLLDMHGIARAQHLAQQIVARDGVSQPIPLSTDEALLLAQYIVQEITVHARPTESGEARDGVVPFTLKLCACGHNTTTHDWVEEVGGPKTRPCTVKGCGCTNFKQEMIVRDDPPYHAPPAVPLYASTIAQQSGLPYLALIPAVADSDVKHILETDPIYDGSWQKRGGTGAYHVGLARKWDRLEHRVRQCDYDVFRAINEDTRREGVIDDVRDLRRYLMLVEAWCVQRGLTMLQTSSKDSTS